MAHRLHRAGFEVSPLLPEVAAALDCLENAARILEVSAVPAFVGQLEAVKVVAVARLAGERGSQMPPVADRLVGVKEVQARTTFSATYLYRHAEALPFFAKRLGRKVLFSEVRLSKWLAQRGA